MSKFAAMTESASKFMADPAVGKAAVIGLEVGIVSSLISLGSYNSTTPEQRNEAQAQQDQRQAAAMLEDARNKEAQADEDRRRAYFANQGPSL
jgi:hypothetical protein